MLTRKVYAALDYCATKAPLSITRLSHQNAGPTPRKRTRGKNDRLPSTKKEPEKIAQSSNYRREPVKISQTGEKPDPFTQRLKDKEELRKEGALESSLKPVLVLAKSLIDVSAQRSAAIHHLDGRELQAKVGENNRVASLEKSVFMGDETHMGRYASDDDAFLADSATRDFQPGTFVEIRRNRIVTFGVIIRIEVLDAKLHALTLTQTGEVWPHLLTDITFSIPNFVPLDLIQRGGSDFRAVDARETAARLQTVEKVRIFARQHEMQYNSQGMQFKDIYEKVCHPDPERWTDITPAELVRHWDQRRPPPVLTLFAAHSHMMEDSLHFVADPINHRASQQFSIRPKAHVETIEQVTNWVRYRDTPFKSFIGKAERIMLEIRRIREKHNEGSPRDMRVDFPLWTPTDLVIIKYLTNALRTHRSLQKDPYDLSLPIIIKFLGLQKREVVDPSIIQRVLCDLGVLAPWDDVVMRNPDLRADMTPLENSKDHKALTELVKSNVQHPGNSVSAELKEAFVALHLPGSTGLIPKDPLVDVRRDFGNLAVYVVDDESAQELDDGLSVEAVPGEGGNYWVHVHIADPTTLLPLGHVLDTFAQTRAVTLYSKHRTWPMFPEAFSSLFSLGARGEGNPQEVITFSVKLSEDGELLDSRVAAGIVRNINIVSYDQASYALGLPLSDRLYPFGKPPSMKEIYPPIPQTQVSDLRKLYHLSLAILKKNIQTSEAFNFTWAVANTEFTSAIPTELVSTRPIAWGGYPDTTYYVEYEARNTYRNVVAQFMILACRAASRFCVEHGLPALRRSNQRPLGEESNLAELLNTRNEFGMVDPVESIKRNIYPRPSELSLKPEAHWALGVPDGEGYTRVTSPLRRYADMLMHWQIKNALLPLSKRQGHGKPLFPSEYLHPLGLRLHTREKITKKADELYRRHWAVAYLARHIQREQKVHGESHNPFPNLVGRSVAPTVLDPIEMTGQVVVYNEFLGLRGHLKGLDRYSDMPIGTEIPLKISKIALGLTPRLEFTSV